MGLVPIGFSLAALLGGGLSQSISASGYTSGFVAIGGALIFVGVGLAILSKKKFTLQKVE
jgi:hypothetical protein